MKLKIIDEKDIKNNKNFVTRGTLGAVNKIFIYKNDSVGLTESMISLKEINVPKPTKDFYFDGWHWKWWMFKDYQKITNSLEIE